MEKGLEDRGIFFGAADEKPVKVSGFMEFEGFLGNLFEEFMEMAGIVIFIYALLDYMSLHLTDLRIRILNSK